MNVFGRHQQAANDQYKATRPQMPPNNLYMETPTTKSTADTDAAHDDNMSTERKESPWTDSKSTNLDDIIRIMSEIDAVETLPMPLPPPNPDLGKMVAKKQLLQRNDCGKNGDSCATSNLINTIARECFLSQSHYQPTAAPLTCIGPTPTSSAGPKRHEWYATVPETARQQHWATLMQTPSTHLVNACSGHLLQTKSYCHRS